MLLLHPGKAPAEQAHNAEDEYGRAANEHDEVGALLVFDEVQTGMGRTGVPFVSGHCGTLPDMMTLAKGLAAGFPIGAVVMTEKIARMVEPGDVAATFGGAPLALAAMRATIAEIKRQELSSHILEIEGFIREEFSLPEVVEIRGKGGLLGLVLDREAKPIQRALFSEGIITGLNSNPNLLHLLPPLTIQRDHVLELKSALRKVLQN